MRRWFLIVLLGLIAPGASGDASDPVVFCHDSDPRPPRFHLGQGEWTGSDMEVLASLFAGSGRDYRVVARPWGRCLQGSAHGAPYQALLSATYSQERAADYYFSDSYYTLTPAYLYLTSDDSNPEQRGVAPSIQRPADLYRYRTCGLTGFSYESFGLKPEALDLEAKRLQQLIDKVIAGRCDIALGRREIFQTLRDQGTLEWPNRLTIKALPGIPREHYYIMVSRQAENARALLRLVNQGISQLPSAPQQAAP